jgi:hypothetical protein
VLSAVRWSLFSILGKRLRFRSKVDCGTDNNLSYNSVRSLSEIGPLWTRGLNTADVLVEGFPAAEGVFVDLHVDAFPSKLYALDA